MVARRSRPLRIKCILLNVFLPEILNVWVADGEISTQMNCKIHRTMKATKVPDIAAEAEAEVGLLVVEMKATAR